MAKITARGDTEHLRFRRDDDGAELVLTMQGRVLYKWRKGESFSLLYPATTDPARRTLAEREAERRGMVKV